MRLAPLLALALSAADVPRGAEQPVYVFLYSRLDDHINHEYSEDRLDRVLARLEEIRQAKPRLTPSCLLLVTGASSAMFAERDAATKDLRSIRSAAKAGLVEVGYDGENEPTHLVRPLPVLRSAKTPDERWLARGEAYRWFLNDYKDRLTGEPDADRTGGLKRTQEIFGPAVTVFGVTSMELGSDSEFVHQLRPLNGSAILPGLPESDTWPARNLDGFGGSLVGVSSALSPEPDCAPEAYWLDGYLRLSSMSKFGVRTVTANAGPEGFKEMLKNLDRSRPHVIRVHLGHPGNYVKPTFNRGVLNPLRWAYENPKRQRVMEADRLTSEESEAAYAKESALLAWLTGEFMPANPGSRFISGGELRRAAQTRGGEQIPIGVIREAAADMLRQWQILGTVPPSYARTGEGYYSLADMFYLIVQALAGSEMVTLAPVYGPGETPEDLGTAGSLAWAEVVKTAAELAPRLSDTAWKPLPSNRIPGRVQAGGQSLYAIQFLRAMAEALTRPERAQIDYPRALSLTPAGDLYPRNRRRGEEGGMWTLKPAPLRFSEAPQSR